MVDWAGISGPAEEYGCGDPDMDMHDPAGHCGPTFGGSASSLTQKALHSFKALGQRTRQLAPVCPYCGETSRLTTGREIYPKRSDLHHKDFYICAPCDAYVGCHMNTLTPLGRLANAELRAAKSAAHRAFDTKWQWGGMTRSRAYHWLSCRLNIPGELCHIGMFDVETCQRVVALCSADDFEVLADA